LFSKAYPLEDVTYPVSIKCYPSAEHMPSSQ
jgi:hypothetical protein